MVQIGNVPEIKAVKQSLDELKAQGLIKDWELPFEKTLTRLTAAIFFLTPTNEAQLGAVWGGLGRHPGLQYRRNEEQRLSELDWRVEFNKDQTGSVKV